MPSCSDYHVCLSACSRGLWLALLCCFAAGSDLLWAVQPPQSAAPTASLPEQIRQLLAQAVTAIDRRDTDASLGLTEQAAGLWDEFAGHPDSAASLHDLETDVADQIVPLLDRLYLRWVNQQTPPTRIAEVLRPFVLSKTGQRVSLLQSSLKGPGYPFVLENCGGALIARTAAAAGVHHEWLAALRQHEQPATADRAILLWLISHEADDLSGQQKSLQQLCELPITREFLQQHGLQVIQILMTGLQSADQSVQQGSLQLLQRVAKAVTRTGGSGVLLRLLRDACILAGPTAFQIESSDSLQKSLATADSLMEQLAAQDDSSPVVRMLTQHYLLTAQMCFVHDLSTAGLQRFSIFRSLQLETSALTASDLRFFLPLQAVHRMSAEDRWKLFQMVVLSDLWLLVREQAPQLATSSAPGEQASDQQRFELIEEIVLAAVQCGRADELRKTWSEGAAIGDVVAQKGLLLLMAGTEKPALPVGSGREQRWLTDDTPEASFGGGSDAVAEVSTHCWYFPWPLTGQFQIINTINSKAANLPWSGYQNVFLDASEVGEVKLRSTSGQVLQKKLVSFDPARSDFSQLLDVAAGKVRLVISGQELWSVQATGNSSPWLFLQSSQTENIRVDGLSITGTPQIPPEVTLLDSTDLRGWSSRLSGQTQPDLQLDSVAGTAQPPVGAPDWQIVSGELTGKRSLQRTAPLAGFPQDCQPIGQIVYQRPLSEGDRVSWEFDYQPGRSQCHPVIGQAVLEILPTGIFLKHSPSAWWEKLAGFSGRRMPLPAVNPSHTLRLGWNQAVLERTSNGFELTLNDQNPIAFSWNPADSRFGFTYLRTRREARVRNIRLRGNWPTEFQQTEFLKVLQTAERPHQSP